MLLVMFALKETYLHLLETEPSPRVRSILIAVADRAQIQMLAAVANLAQVVRLASTARMVPMGKTDTLNQQALQSALR